MLCVQRQRVTISHDATVGSVVTRVAATDADSGLNARLVYGIVSGNDRNVFHMDPLTGTVILDVPGKSLDHAQYLLDVAVSDSGQPPLTSSVELTIDVTSQLMTSRAGGGRTSLMFIVVTVGIVTSLITTIAVVVIISRQKCARTTDVERPPAMTTKATAALDGDFDDNDEMSALFAHLSRSHNARSMRSRDLPVSTVTLNAARNNDTRLSSLDSSVVSAPAACQASMLINSL